MGDRDDDSFYLVYIGTKPTARGKGYARKLIEHGTSMVSEATTLTYIPRICYSHEIYRRMPQTFRRI
jgi:predicted acetyltransferase